MWEWFRTYYVNIDWQGTGSMLQGITTLIGAVAVLIAAKIGRETFEDWRRQKKEERKIAVAEDTLAMAYRLKRAFESIRLGGMLEWEIADVDAKLTAAGLVGENTPQNRRSMLRVAQAALSRAEHYRPKFDQLNEMLPTVKAILGADVEQALNEFWVSLAKIRSAANAYAHLARADPANEVAIEGFQRRQEELEDLLWEGHTLRGPDSITNDIAIAIGKLESKLLPIVRDDPA